MLWADSKASHMIRMYSTTDLLSQNPTFCLLQEPPSSSSVPRRTEVPAMLSFGCHSDASLYQGVSVPTALSLFPATYELFQSGCTSRTEAMVLPGSVALSVPLSQQEALPPISLVFLTFSWYFPCYKPVFRSFL